MALGDGSIQLVSIPVSPPSTAERTGAEQRAAAGPGSQQHPLVRLPPDAAAKASDLSGTLASTLEWLPSPPHDRLLVS